ncbi:MAG: DUF2232 domain-containing protein [Spirochaetia bacterium]|jgi:hypothetical protein
MYQRSSSGHYFEILLFTLSSLLLYHTGVGIALFLVPLQIVASRRGIRSLAIAAGAFLAVFLLIRCLPAVFSKNHALPDIMGLIEIGVAGVLLLGMIVVNVRFPRRPRTLVMLLAATALAGAAALPATVWLSGVPAFQQALDARIAELSKMLSSANLPMAESGVAALLTLLGQPAQARRVLEAYLLRTLLADYAIMLAFSWWAGQAAATRARVSMGAEPGFRFSRLRLESVWLWPLIVSGALVLADLSFGISVWAYAAWNIGLVLLFLFGLQGMAIVLFLFEKYGIPRLFWFLLVVGLVILAARSGAGLFIVLLIPLLGISENWIRYRIPREAAPTE